MSGAYPQNAGSEAVPALLTLDADNLAAGVLNAWSQDITIGAYSAF